MLPPTTTRREFLKAVGAGTLALGLPLGAYAAGAKKPNVLFIAIDDLNDWIGCLGGQPDVKTPNLDRLAKRGVLFTNAHCPAPACNPSRAALMTGIRPSTSGVYYNSQPWRQSPVLSKAVTLPQHFTAHGYTSIGSGKIFHGRFPDPDSWQEYWPSPTQNRPKDALPPQEKRPLNGIPRTGNFDWGPIDAAPAEMSDWQVADWTIGQLGKAHDRPFFMACGFFRPHLPWFAPKKYFDMYPLAKIALPNVKEDDLDDVPAMGQAMAKRIGDHAKVVKNKQWREAVQGYLASISFADECVGRVLRALDESAHRDNTVIVLWSDHGWHLGEKLHWRKFSLWEEATHNVLMMAGPGISSPGARCDAPVNLLDIYPTLIDLCDLERREELEGVSLAPLLKDPKAKWDRPALTTHGRGNHSIRSRRWRYTQYADKTEELYDHSKDELEWTNLAGNPEFAAVKQDLQRWLPQKNAPESPRNRKAGKQKRRRQGKNRG